VQGDGFPLSLRLALLRSALAKLDPRSVPKPLPQLRRYQKRRRGIEAAGGARR
jgi:hypothetical protein